VTVTVLPKPCSSQAGVVHDFAHTPGATTHVVLHETDLAALSTTASSVGALAMSLSDVARNQADLLDLGAPPESPVSETAVSGDPFRDLMLLAERGRLTTSPLSFEGAFAPSLLRLLTHERLLQVVESLIFRARPRYAERTETLEMPRGRLSEHSLLLSLATGTPRVESTFDELTIDTPLLQVVASALRVIARGATVVAFFLTERSRRILAVMPRPQRPQPGRVGRHVPGEPGSGLRSAASDDDEGRQDGQDHIAPNRLIWRAAFSLGSVNARSWPICL
jgi:hypothetical protein